VVDCGYLLMMLGSYFLGGCVWVIVVYGLIVFFVLCWVCVCLYWVWVFGVSFVVLVVIV